MTTPQPIVHFHEEQQFRQIWLWALLLVISVVAIWAGWSSRDIGPQICFPSSTISSNATSTSIQCEEDEKEEDEKEEDSDGNTVSLLVSSTASSTILHIQVSAMSSSTPTFLSMGSNTEDEKEDSDGNTVSLWVSNIASSTPLQIEVSAESPSTLSFPPMDLNTDDIEKDSDGNTSGNSDDPTSNIWPIEVPAIASSTFAFLPLGLDTDDNIEKSVVAINALLRLTVPMISLLVVLAILYLMYSIKLVTEVGSDGIYIRYFPFLRRRIPLDEISSYEARTYSLLEFGGWGVRWMPGRGWAYNVSGFRGVQLVFTNGKRLMIGSQRPEELARAIAEGMEE